MLEIAANGEETARLKRLTIELGIGERVEFSGMLGSEDLARSYRRSAIFISVPVSDGTSVSLLEAMAAGCVPVLSDLPANREWVTDQCNGLLVSDTATLGASLQRAIDWWESGDWDRHGRAVNERLITEHALFERNIEQFLALYERLQVRHP
jgi:glycosyltransferase involved in cell wall biosynthesis